MDLQSTCSGKALLQSLWLWLVLGSRSFIHAILWFCFLTMRILRYVDSMHCGPSPAQFLDSLQISWWTKAPHVILVFVHFVHGCTSMLVCAVICVCLCRFRCIDQKAYTSAASHAINWGWDPNPIASHGGQPCRKAKEWKLDRIAANKRKKGRSELMVDDARYATEVGIDRKQ